MLKEKDQNIEYKQNYLRTEIVDKDLDPEIFLEFLKEYRNEEEIDLEYIHYKDLEKVRLF